MLFRPYIFPDVNEVNTFIIGCEKTREAVLVDAGVDSPDYDAFLKEHNAKLTGIFLTHFHWDHDQELPALAKRFDVPVYSMTGKTPNSKSNRQKKEKFICWILAIFQENKQTKHD